MFDIKNLNDNKDSLKTNMVKDMNNTGSIFHDSKNQFKGKTTSNLMNRNNANSRLEINTSESNMRTITYDYERKLHTSHANRAFEVALTKDFKVKSLKSDIFFQNSKEKTKSLNLNALLKRNSSESNVFFLQNKGMINDRSSEKYYYHPRAHIYGITSASNSKWCPSTENKTLINFSNVDYSLFNTGIKNLSKTKEEIIKSSKLNPVFRQKSISESIDIFGLSCSNPNRNYIEIAQKHKNAFHLNSEVCSTFLDLHKNYRGLCAKPFVKKII